jgi:hypothetical protein
VRGRQAIQGAYLIDINAMVFGMPRALFPALATTLFGGGASTLGFLYAAPGAGALVGALTTGWVSRVRRQGLAVIVAVLIWGAAITCFGLVSWLPGALALLAVAGWADVISAVFRNTIIQQAVPDALRGRLSGLQTAVVSGGPRIGDVESGAVATAFGNTISVMSGGLACIAGALVLARLLPGFRQQRMPEHPPEHPPERPSQAGQESSLLVFGVQRIWLRPTATTLRRGARAAEVKGGRLCHEQYRPPFDGVFTVSEFEYGTCVEVAGIEPASFGASPGLLRAQLALLFSAPAITQARRRRAQPLFDVPPGPATGSGSNPSS